MESSAGGSFTISDGIIELSRGTCITLHMKDDQLEYLEEARIRDIINKHSQFITYPIMLQCHRERQVEAKQETVQENADESQALKLFKKMLMNHKLKLFKKMLMNHKLNLFKKMRMNHKLKLFKKMLMNHKLKLFKKMLMNHKLKLFKKIQKKRLKV